MILMISDEKKTLNVFIIIFIKLRFRNPIILIVNKKLVELSIFEFLLFAFLLYLLLISVLIIYMLIQTAFITCVSMYRNRDRFH